MKIINTKLQTGFSTLFSVLVIGVVGTVIASSLLLLSIGSSQNSLTLERSTQARALSNACAETALKAIKQAENFLGSGSVTLGGGSCTYNVTQGEGDNKIISSAGSINSIIRKLEIMIDTSPELEVISWQEVAD